MRRYIFYTYIFFLSFGMISSCFNDESFAIKKSGMIKNKSDRKVYIAISSDANKIVNNLKIESVGDFEREFIRLHPLFKQRKIKINPFTFQKNKFDLTPYKNQFKILEEDSSKVNCITATYRNYIIQLIKENRIGTALNYQVG